MSSAHIAPRTHQWSTRLAQIERRTPLEQQAMTLIEAIEQAGADARLTTAQSLVFEAVCALGAWHDAGEPGKSPGPRADLDHG